ncbi:MAG: PhoH family protein [Proteobacteria bacterium]|nr:PhoH family protein [Pseudomonadota bacterium]
MKKTFVLDTNVLLSDPRAIQKLRSHDVVIPLPVIEEIDTFKKSENDLGRNARMVSRYIDSLRERGKLQDGVKIEEGQSDCGLIKVAFSLSSRDHLFFDHDSVDNKILSLILDAKKALPSAGDSSFSGEYILVTRDANLRIKADALGIKAIDHQDGRVEEPSPESDGVATLIFTEDDYLDFMRSGTASYPEGCGLVENQFAQITCEDFEDDGIEVVCRNGSLRKIDTKKLSVLGLEPRNMEQGFALSALLNPKIPLVTITGSAGTGKTLLALAAGLMQATESSSYDKVLVARPVMPLGKDLGFLPGDIKEKLTPWMMPIFDNLDLIFSDGKGKTPHRKGNPGGGVRQKEWEMLIEQGILSIEPLTYIRGRSLPRVFFIIDEAQNLTPHEIKTILTRVGEGTKIIFTGDPGQIDNPYLDSHSNGLSYLIERFRGQKLSAHIPLSQGERSDLATLAAKLL